MSRLRLRAIAAAAAAVGLLQFALPTGARGAADWMWPLRGEVITHYRNGDDPYAGGQHRGIDIAARVGTPVAAATSGAVTFAGTAASSGRTVTVRTGDGRFDTSYLHLSSIVVRKGARVERGARLGAVGTTGRRSATAPHLHFGVREAGSRHAYHDPLEFLPPPAGGPAPRVPSGAPLPVPAPLRPAPAPTPVGAPLPGHAPAPARHRARRPAPRPARDPRRLPHGAPEPAAALAPAHAPVHTAHRRAGTAPARRRERASLGAGPQAEPEPAAPAERAPSPAREAPAAPARGPDLGLVLACLGLLVAATLVGGTEEGRAAAARGRARMASALRPLLGRGAH